MVDYVAGGFLEDLTARIAKDKDLKEDDIAPFFRDFSQKYQRQGLYADRWMATST